MNASDLVSFLSNGSRFSKRTLETVKAHFGCSADDVLIAIAASDGAVTLATSRHPGVVYLTLAD